MTLESAPKLEPEPSTPSPESSASPPPGLLRLFLEFAKISVVGFGGVMVWARRSLVEKHKWMTADEFNECFALCQFLPGPNMVNLSVIFGTRLAGPIGGLVAFVGLLGSPVLIVIGVGFFYANYGDAAVLRRVLHGISCAGIGLFASVAFKMLMPLIQRRDLMLIGVLLAVFITVGVMRWPTPYVLLVAVPVSLALSYFMHRQKSAKAPEVVR